MRRDELGDFGGGEIADRGDTLKELLHSTVNSVIAFDKEELAELLDEFKDVAEEEDYEEDLVY